MEKRRTIGEKMRKTAFIMSVALFCLYSCSTKVDLYTGYTDMTIVYGVLDVTKDTNMIKISRAFAGNNEEEFDPYQIIQIADSLNYPGKLDARFIELKCVQGNDYVPTGREIVFDTLTIHNKEEGLFYAPDQKLYYTTTRFNVNSGNQKYRYKLVVCKANDTITSEIGLLGGSNFQIHSGTVYFKSEISSKTHKLYFVPDDNGGIYQIGMRFNYKELRKGQDTVMKAVEWSLGSFSELDLGYENGAYYVTYPENALFTFLSNAIGNDILNVERFFSSFIVSISAYGNELYEYMLTNNASGIVDYSYTNIHGGVGVISSRYEIERSLKLSGRTQMDLLAMPWGFKNLGYKD